MSYKVLLSTGEKNTSLEHTKPCDHLLEFLESDMNKGLGRTEAERRLSEFGSNELAAKAGETIWEKIKEAFSDLLVRILLVAAVISFAISMTGSNI